MSFTQEYNAIRHSAGVIKRGLGFAKVSGDETDEFLLKTVARSLEYAAPGSVVESLVLDDEGKPVDQVICLIDEAEVLLISSSQEDLGKAIEAAAADAGFDDLNVEAMPQWSAVQLEGPKSPSLVADLIEDEIASLSLNEWVSAKLPNKDDDSLAAEVLLARTGTTGEYGYLVCANVDAETLLNHFVDKAVAVDGIEVSSEAWTRASLEVSHSVFPELYANDLDVVTAGLWWMAGAGREDDYNGKDSLEAIEKNSGLVAFHAELTEDQLAELTVGSDVQAGDEKVGVVHAVSPFVADQPCFGLLLLDKPFCVPGLNLNCNGHELATISRPAIRLISWTEPLQ